MVLVGFIHDLGKCLCLYGEPQWGVVGDTFPVGCAWSDQIVFPQYFSKNPDAQVPAYQAKYGIYGPNCGLENVHMSFGHDGYIAEVMKPYLSDEAIYMLRFHSLLRVASSWGLSTPRKCQRQSNAGMGEEVQSL
jgi:inositol oxygenase